MSKASGDVTMDEIVGVLGMLPTPATADADQWSCTQSVALDATAAMAEMVVGGGVRILLTAGSFGEGASLTWEEHQAFTDCLVQTVGRRSLIFAGATTLNTRDTIARGRGLVALGADGLFLGRPMWMSLDPHDILRFYRDVSEALPGVPVIVYDIPGRTGTPIHTETLLRMAAHPRIVAVKDAKGDLFAASEVMSQTDLQWYCGDDALNLAHLTQGAAGIISVVGHLAGRQYAEMVAAVAEGNLSRAIEIHRQLIPAVNAIMHTTQGAITVKAALHDRGVIASAVVRLPLVSLTNDQLARVREGLEQSGLT